MSVPQQSVPAPGSNAPDQAPMVNWFSPPQLTRTGLLALLSDIFGTFADRREMQAALTPNAQPNQDWAEKEEVWLDFISDLGEGWDSTYSMAYLLAHPTLDVSTRPAKQEQAEQATGLRQADIVLIGGDLVYPTPTKQEYERRFTTPYETAQRSAPAGPAADGQLFAIPGNHDWYDGLGAFLKMMCQQRSVGGRQTRQQRSYFAIQLPYNWWVWGIDIQLHAEIDEAQKEYFRKACRMAKPGDKVILLTAEPVWVYPGYKTNMLPLDTLRFFCEEFITKPLPGSDQPILELPLILSGDLHHYASYTGIDPATNKQEWRITAGGGGAFLHPTHQLKEHLQMPNQGPLYQGTFYPSQPTSRWLTFQNLLFPLRNWPFVALLCCVYLLFVWALLGTEIHFQSVNHDLPNYGNLTGPIFALLRQVEPAEYENVLGWALMTKPWLMLIPLLLMVSLYQFTDIKTVRKWAARVWSAVHSITQLIALVAVPLLFVLLVDHTALGQRTFNLLSGSSWRLPATLGIAVAVAFIGAFVGSMLMGIYLLISLLVLHTHENEGYSSLRIPDYKNFLRMHLTKDGLRVYAIGVDKVCRDWQVSQGVTGWVVKPKQPLEAHLIERSFLVK